MTTLTHSGLLRFLRRAEPNIPTAAAVSTSEAFEPEHTTRSISNTADFDSSLKSPSIRTYRKTGNRLASSCIQTPAKAAPKVTCQKADSEPASSSLATQAESLLDKDAIEKQGGKATKLALGLRRSSVKKETPLRQKTVRQVFKKDAQYYIDVGQKDFGPAPCGECGMLYTKGLEEDEELHGRYHRLQESNLNANKVKKILDEICTKENISIGCLNESTYQLHHNKLKPILDIVNADLGYIETKINGSEFKIFFAISGAKKVIGCLIMERIEHGYPIVITHDSDDISPSPYESANATRFYMTQTKHLVTCGIHTLWVHSSRRKQGIASKMLDTARNHFIFGYLIPKEQIAISHPSELGLSFATRYFGARVLIY